MLLKTDMVRISSTVTLPLPPQSPTPRQEITRVQISGRRAAHSGHAPASPVTSPEPWGVSIVPLNAVAGFPEKTPVIVTS
jgi:hypothetical protein